MAGYTKKRHEPLLYRKKRLSTTCKRIYLRLNLVKTRNNVIQRFDRTVMGDKSVERIYRKVYIRCRASYMRS